MFRVLQIIWKPEVGSTDVEEHGLARVDAEVHPGFDSGRVKNTLVLPDRQVLRDSFLGLAGDENAVQVGAVLQLIVVNQNNTRPYTLLQSSEEVGVGSGSGSGSFSLWSMVWCVHGKRERRVSSYGCP